jgi:hypothetical protein
MAAYVLRCDGCGEPFAAVRKDHRWHSEACRKATKRALGKNDPTVPEHEPLVVNELAAGRLVPHNGILWVVFPEGMRRRYPHKVLGPA